MRRIIFDTEINGHHLEYIHHLYMGALKDCNNEYIFAIPETFHEVKHQFDWPPAQNVLFHFIGKKELKKCLSHKIFGFIYESFLAKKIIKAVKGDEIILIFLMRVMPFLPIILPSKVKISGIIYDIYLHNNYNNFRLLYEKIRYKIIVKYVKKAYILNDKNSTSLLNRRYRTQVFKFLPDPIPDKAFEPYSHTTDNLKIEGTVYLHFGHMKKRKGTLDILHAISMLPPNHKGTFIFAGIIDIEIKEEFYQLIENNKSKNLIVFERYCDYRFINDLCYKSDCILIPYYNTAQSSGVLGYAAAHKIPVIGPEYGLLGQLIKDNNLGVTIPEVTPKAILTTMLQIKNYIPSEEYSISNSLDNFIHTIINN